MSDTGVSGPTLGAALTALEAAASAAGIDPTDARSEGEALAATVAEAATGAWVDWLRETERTGTAEDFTVAASRGRRWRSGPTPSLHQLTLAGSPQAAAYARALGDACLAGARLGRPTSRTIGNATTAASAQLAAASPLLPRPDSPPRAPAGSALGEQVFRTPATGPVPSQGPQAGPHTGADEVVTETVRGLWTEVMGELRTVSNRLREISPGAPTPPPELDLDGADPFGPGRFPLDPGSVGTRPGPVVDPGADPGGADAHGAGSGTPALATSAAAPAAPPVPQAPPRSLEDLLAELDGLVGLRAVKAEIHRQVALLRVEAKRKEAGLKTPSITRHLVFVGNPGTGKTTVARLVGGIYRALGLLTKGQLIEVDRSELVAGYLGQTAMKTADVVKSAEGGVLFIDEAYSLAGDQYGTEAIDTLVKEMEDKRDDLVVIVAGYPLPMEAFIAQNPGLASRFRTTIRFADYTDDELVAIFGKLASESDYDVDTSVEARFRDLLAHADRGSSFGNGRFARNTLEAAIGAHAWRLRDVADPDVSALRTLEPQDLTPDADALDLTQPAPPGTPAAAPPGPTPEPEEQP